MRGAWLALAVALCLVVQGCTHKRPLIRPDFSPVHAGRSARVLVMPVDVEVFELTMAGIPKPRADWTLAASTNLDAAVDHTLRGKGVEILDYEAPGDDLELEHSFLQLQKLHSAVANALFAHELGPSLGMGMLWLPTLNKRFDWSLGREAESLAGWFDADYALFVFVRDSYESAGRMAVSVAVAALGGVAAPGQQIGFASLVNLRTGNLVWCNHILANRSLMVKPGDLRSPDSTFSAVGHLLADVPL